MLLLQLEVDGMTGAQAFFTAVAADVATAVASDTAAPLSPQGGSQCW